MVAIGNKNMNPVGIVKSSGNTELIDQVILNSSSLLNKMQSSGYSMIDLSFEPRKRAERVFAYKVAGLAPENPSLFI